LANADFYLLDRKVVNAINTCGERNTSLFGLLIWLGFNQDSVTYQRRARMSGKSKWNFKSRLRLATDWIIAFSGIPLRFVTYLGIFISLLGFVYALGVFINVFLFGSPVQGWASLMVVILFLSGIQMILLGTFGEYLWRNLDESRKRPLYFLEKSTHKKSKKHDK